MKRGIAGLRSEPIDSTQQTFLIQQLTAQPQKRSRIWPTMRYLALGGAVAAGIGFAMLPRTSNAASIRDIMLAVKQQTSRYEQVFKPDKNGKLYMYFEQWGAPGKYANRFQGENETRQDGRLTYRYSQKENCQTVELGKASEIDEVGIEAFSHFKLSRVVEEGKTLRYEYAMDPGRQDLVVDAETKLPLERNAYLSDGSLLESHKYRFQSVDPSVFEPNIKPGVPYFNIPEDRKVLLTELAQGSQHQVVGGINIQLYAVIADANGNVGAVVSGGLPQPVTRPYAMKFPMEVAGTQKGISYPSSVNFEVAGESARLEQVYFASKPKIGDQFKLRIPVFKVTGQPPIGWAEFNVKHVIRTYSAQIIMPNYVIPDNTEAKAVAVSKDTRPPR